MTAKYKKSISEYLKKYPQKYKIAKLVLPLIDWSIEDVHYLSKGGHPDIFFIETPKRWYYFYMTSKDSGEIIGNDADGISHYWQSKLKVRSEGMLEFKTDILKETDFSSKEAKASGTLKFELSKLKELEDHLHVKFIRVHSDEDYQPFGYLMEKNHVILLTMIFNKDTDAIKIFEIIQHFTRLRNLTIYDYNCEFIPKELSTLKHLENFHISPKTIPRENVLKIIHPWIGDLIKLKEFSILDCDIEFLPVEITKLRNLNILRIQKGKLKAIPENIGDLVNLTQLRLGNNQIEEIPESLCNLRNLQFLELNGNRITKLPKEFGNLTELQNLNIFANRISDFPTSCIKLIKLNRINIGYNQIRELPKFLLKPNPNLTIDGNRNLIRVFPKNYIKNSYKRNFKLHFKSNVLPIFSEDSWICENCGAEFVLTSSDIGNKICQYCKTRNPSVLRITNYKFEENLVFLKKNAKKMKQLEIDVKDMTKVINSLPDMPNLLILKLGNLKTISIPDIFSRFTSLKSLSLITENLEEIPSSLSDLENLKYLSIQSNKITQWNLESNKLENLEFLALSIPKLIRIPKTLVNCKKLKILFLDFRNKNLEIPKEIYKMPSLERINLPSGYREILPAFIWEKFKLEKDIGDILVRI